MRSTDIAKTLPRPILQNTVKVFLNFYFTTLYILSNMANTRRKRGGSFGDGIQLIVGGDGVAAPRKRGRPRTRPERTTPKRPYKRSYRYTKVARAERKAKAAFKRERKGDF